MRQQSTFKEKRAKKWRGANILPQKLQKLNYQGWQKGRLLGLAQARVPQRMYDIKMLISVKKLKPPMEWIYQTIIAKIISDQNQVWPWWTTIRPISKIQVFLLKPLEVLMNNYKAWKRLKRVKIFQQDHHKKIVQLLEAKLSNTIRLKSKQQMRFKVMKIKLILVGLNRQEDWVKSTKLELKVKLVNLWWQLINPKIRKKNKICLSYQHIQVRSMWTVPQINRQILPSSKS